MAYFTGTANTPADLKTLVETKAVLAGWTLDGLWLNKGINHVKLTAVDANYLTIVGANTADGSAEVSSMIRAIQIATIYWPVTYYLFINTAPDTIVLVVKYATNKIQTIQFGNIVKIHDSAYVGGNFFHGTTDLVQGTTEFSATGVALTVSFLESGGASFGTPSTCVIPFTASPVTNFRNTPPNPLHVKIDTAVWPDTDKISYTDTTISSLFRSPNLYNSQTHLVPMNLQFAMSDSLYGYLGYVEHIRLVRVDNYEIGDLITISPDVWKVFPWLLKNTINRNGGGTSGHSGTLGFAVRYTP